MCHLQTLLHILSNWKLKNLKLSNVLKSMRRTKTISAWFCDGTAGLSSVRNTGWKHLEITEGLFFQRYAQTPRIEEGLNVHTEEFTVSYFNVSHTSPLLIIAGMDPVFSVEAKRGKNFDPGGGGSIRFFQISEKAAWNWENRRLKLRKV